MKKQESYQNINIMNENLKILLEGLRKAREKYGDSPQKPATSKEVEKLNKAVMENFNIELSPVYKSILLKTNGFNENGVFLYGSETNLIAGYSDRYLEGIMEANEIWREDDDFSNYLFYAESDLYLFAQSLKDQLYSCRARDSFDDVIFETNDDNDFFEKIFKLAFDDEFHMED
ncbi:MAG: YrhA family protein [Helicobacteraceae bacterium]|jgi:hypothetical protein|nr:YrhA family protein [Helicobacteraceae bacterium]